MLRHQLRQELLGAAVLPRGKAVRLKPLKARGKFPMACPRNPVAAPQGDHSKHLVCFARAHVRLERNARVEPDLNP